MQLERKKKMSEKKVDFEKAMEELENIVEKLEKGDLNLDESVKKFEDGMKLSKTCTKILNEAEKKINLLIETPDGIEEESFTPEE